jgi:two-component system, OmpR family, sensor histidine kinase MprB
MTVLVATTIAVAAVLVGGALQVVIARTLVGEVDRALVGSLVTLGGEGRGPIGERLARRDRDDVLDELDGLDDLDGLGLGGRRRDRFGGAVGVVQLVTADGRTLRSRIDADAALPVDERTLAIAAGRADATLATVTVDGRPLRLLTAPLVDGVAVQVARPLDEVRAVTRLVRRRTVITTLLAALVGALGAWVVAGRATRPIARLTAAVESVRSDDDLVRRVGLGRDDEVGRLARAFDDLLARLEAARDARERLVADASHELRTPITSLRTNLEVLALEEGRLDPGARSQLVADVLGQLEELSSMVDGLVRTARSGGTETPMVVIRVDTLVGDALERARRRHPRRAVDLTSTVPEPLGTAEVLADPDRLAMALTELVDNAAKHAAAGEVALVATAAELPGGRPAVRVAVSDRGPGVDAAELPLLFDRFHRTAEARATPGSGLGLSMVEAVAAQHGGTADARRRTDGGLDVGMTLPTV